MSDEKHTVPVKAASPNYHIWLVASALFLLPPLIFWVIVETGLEGGHHLLRFWDIFPASFLRPLIAILPLPALILSIISFISYYRGNRTLPLILSAVCSLVSLTAVVVAGIAAVQIPF
ncbi:hypothetical protein KKA00_08725 [bacterium]|nr:hypothetical protein [bacterium]MBU1652290.1 hypothetical protein [bacterium]MBU1880540.1 hypothetical protein [bacterium]